jgi:hypothetical protein
LTFSWKKPDSSLQYCSCLVVCMVARYCHREVQVSMQILRFAMAAFQMGIYPNLQALQIMNAFLIF